MSFIKRFLRNTAGNFGYQIQKYPSSTEFLKIPVFDLCVQLLMASKGNKLSFIEVGANNGDSDPLKRYILNFPWHGILIEPQPDVFSELCRNYESARERLIFENVAISTIASGLSRVTMYRGNNEHYTITSLHKRVTSKLAPDNMEKLTVPCTTLDQLIQKHGISSVDILQIDAEGHDYDVLKTINLNRHSPLVIQFEHGLLSPHDVNNVVGYLSSHGYRILYGGHQMGDTVALHKSFPMETDPDIHPTPP